MNAWKLILLGVCLLMVIWPLLGRNKVE